MEFNLIILMIQININYRYYNFKNIYFKVVIQIKLIYSIQIYNNKILLALNNISNIYLKQKIYITTYKS